MVRQLHWRCVACDTVQLEARRCLHGHAHLRQLRHQRLLWAEGEPSTPSQQTNGSLTELVVPELPDGWLSHGQMVYEDSISSAKTVTLAYYKVTMTSPLQFQVRHTPHHAYISCHVVG